MAFIATVVGIVVKKTSMVTVVVVVRVEMMLNRDDDL